MALHNAPPPDPFDSLNDAQRAAVEHGLDGDPRAAYAILDVAGGVIELRCVAYDVASAQRRILDAGLPASLARRLATGD